MNKDEFIIPETDPSESGLPMRLSDELVARELQVTLTYGQCNLIIAMIKLTHDMDDWAQYQTDIEAIKNAMGDAMRQDFGLGGTDV